MVQPLDVRGALRGAQRRILRPPEHPRHAAGPPYAQVLLFVLRVDASGLSEPIKKDERTVPINATIRKLKVDYVEITGKMDSR